MYYIKYYTLCIGRMFYILLKACGYIDYKLLRWWLVSLVVVSCRSIQNSDSKRIIKFTLCLTLITFHGSVAKKFSSFSDESNNIELWAVCLNVKTLWYVLPIHPHPIITCTSTTTSTMAERFIFKSFNTKRCFDLILCSFSLVVSIRFELLLWDAL